MNNNLYNLVKLETSMFKLYDELLDLELNGKKNTKEYLDKYSLFLDCFPIEDKYIKNCSELYELSDYTIDKILGYSREISKNVNFFHLDLENTVENNCITSRIINKSLALIYGTVMLSDEDYVMEAIGKINYLITKEMDYNRFNALSKLLKIDNDDEKMKIFLTKYLHSLKFVNASDEIDLNANNNRDLFLKSGYNLSLVSSLYSNTIKEVTNLAISGILGLDDDSLLESQDDVYELEVLCGELLAAFNLCYDYYEKCNYINYMNQIFAQIRLTNNKMLANCSYSLEKVSILLTHEFNLAREEEEENINKKFIKLDKFVIKI